METDGGVATIPKETIYKGWPNNMQIQSHRGKPTEYKLEDQG